MISPGLAILPCLWAGWNIIGVIIIYTMTIVEGHNKTPYISISEAGAKFPESMVLMVVSTVSELLDAVIMYVMYRLIEIKTEERTVTCDIVQKILLAVGWLSIVGNITTTHLQVSTLLNCITTAALLCSALYNLFVTEPRNIVSRHRTCVLITKEILSVFWFLAAMSLVGCKIVTLSDCSSDSCKQNIRFAVAILEWTLFIFDCADKLLLYLDFQILTIKPRKSLKKDWIILREDLGDTLPLYKKSSTNFEI